jgi:hypothetical protein
LGTRRNEDKKNKNTIQKTEVAINNIQSSDTSNIGHTRHRRTTIGFSIIDFPFCLLCGSFALIVVCILCCVPNVACISGLFIIDCPFCLLCCSFAFIVVLLCLVCPMLLVSLDCILRESQ